MILPIPVIRNYLILKRNGRERKGGAVFILGEAAGHGPVMPHTEWLQVSQTSWLWLCWARAWGVRSPGDRIS